MNNDSIYYYTSDFVLKSWIENQTIWATRSITSNDNKDTHYITELIDENIKTDYVDMIKKQMDLCKNISLRILKDVIFYYNINNTKDFLSLALGCYQFANRDTYFIDDGIEISRERIINNKYAEQLLYQIIKGMNDQEKRELFGVDFIVTDNILEQILSCHYPFVICFTHEYDNRFLWDSYTNNKGVCLEFSKRELTEYIKQNYYEENIDLYMNIIYDKEFQVDKLKNNIEMKTCIAQFQQLGASFKHEFWKPEKEFRLIFGVKYIQDRRFEIKENYNKKYDNRSKTQDYVEVKIPKKLVKSITIGPLCNLDEEYLRNILKDVNIEIKQSIGKGIINN